MNFSTIGGNIAENAGGMRAVKYGVTRDSVMGLEVVMPSGQVVKTGSKCIKDVVGYDLSSLFVGLEGTLGIITRAILKLVPLPEARRTMTAAFPSLNQAATTVVEIIRSRVAANESERARLWKMRRSISPAISRFPIRGDGEDIVVPITRIPDIIGKMDGICHKYGLFAINFGHAGDGNIHVNLVEKKEAVMAHMVAAASSEILKEVVRMEGRIAAEHGIGVVKKGKIGLNIDPPTLELMRSVKKKNRSQ